MTEHFWGEPIFSYSRQQALADGVLVDVSAMAREAGFKYPTAVSAALWQGFIVPDAVSRQAGQSEDGRLWDVLMVLRAAVLAGGTGGEVHFPAIFFMRGTVHEEVRLKCVCGPGDDPAPVLTVMLPEED